MKGLAARAHKPLSAQSTPTSKDRHRGTGGKGMKEGETLENEEERLGQEGGQTRMKNRNWDWTEW